MSKKIYFSLLGVFITFSLIFGQSAIAATDKPIEWKCSLFGSPRAWTNPIERWAKEMEKLTNGRFKCKLYYGEQLGPAKEQLSGIKAGLFDIAFMVVGYDPGKTPLMDVLNLARVMPEDTYKAALVKDALLRHPAIVKELESRWNAVVLLTDVLPSYTIMGKKPIRTLKDIKGVRLRVHGGAAATMFKELGAVPVSITTPETYDALSKGIIDAAFNGWYAHGELKLYEISKYATSGWELYVGAGSAVVVNKDAWNALPPDVRAINDKLRKEALQWWTEEFEKSDKKWLPTFKEKGIEFFELSAEDQAQLDKMAIPIQEQWVKNGEAKGFPTRDVLNYLKAKRKEVAGY